MIVHADVAAQEMGMRCMAQWLTAPWKRLQLILTDKSVVRPVAVPRNILSPQASWRSHGSTSQRASLSRQRIIDGRRTATRIGWHVVAHEDKIGDKFGNSCSGAFSFPSCLSSPVRVIEKGSLALKRARGTPLLLIINALMTNFRWRVPIAALHALSHTLRHHVRFHFAALASAEVVPLFCIEFLSAKCVFPHEGSVLASVFEHSLATHAATRTRLLCS